MNVARLVAVASAAGAVSAGIPSQLESRDFTGPPCEPDFQWTDNENNISPCVLAATVYGTCAGSTWVLRPLDSGTHYDPPAGDLVNQCSCSWAAYNLVSACTVCQGFEQSVLTWPFYATNCSGQTSNQYFPSTQALPDDIGIPFYAANNPTTWNDQRFNIEQAREIHDQGHHDVVQSLPQKSSSPPVGAIVGGVIGGLAVIAIACGLAFYMYRKKHKQTAPSVTHVGADGSKHGRTTSDLSQKSAIGYGRQPFDRSFTTSPSSQPPLSPTSGTLHTHTASVNSLSYFGSVSHSVIPYGTSASPHPAARSISPATQSPSPPPNTQGLNREDIIVPFILPHSANSHQASNSFDRKRPDGAIIPVYDHPNSQPTHAVPADTFSGTSTSRPRVNPPAYTSVDEVSIAPSHSKNDSGDTQFSIDSKTGGVISVETRHGGVGGGSMSGIDD
ncbi:hypothetical protein E4T56_gene15446, partial [Termitomyces sp. T112]